MKPNQINRRNFLRRAGLLVSGLGISASVQSGLLDAITKKAVRRWGREALAQSAVQPVHFVIEISIYLGHQFNTLLATKGHKLDARGANLNFYSSPGMVTPYKPNAARAQDLYIVKYPMDPFTGVAGASGGDNLLAALQQVNGASGQRFGVAASDMFLQPDVNHRTNFIARAPNTSAPSPNRLHASVAPAAPVQAIHWNGGPVENQVGSVNGLDLATIAEVGDAEQLVSLFRPLPMYFTSEEFKILAGTFDEQSGDLTRAGVIDDFDQSYLISAAPGASDVYATRSKPGRNQATLDHIANIQNTYNAQASKFANLDTVLDGAPLQKALNYALAAFHDGSTTTFSIALQESDWHNEIPGALDDSNTIQGRWNAYLGNALAGVIRAAAELTDPFTGHTTNILDSLLVNVTSEFTRTPNLTSGGSNNDDGGTWGGVMLGSRVNTGCFGNIRGDGSIQSFDRTTGALAAGPAPTQAMWYKATCDAMGIPTDLTDSIVPMGGDALGGRLPIFLK